MSVQTNFLKNVSKNYFAVEINNLKDEADFQKLVLENKKPVIIDFYADWCGPCKVIAPILQKKAETSQGNWDFLKIDIDNHPQIAQMFGVQSIPTVFLIHEGKGVDKFMGVNQEKVNSFVEQAEQLGAKE